MRRRCDGRGFRYNFTLLDELYDAILGAGMKPIVELSFMPAAIANCTVNTTGAGGRARGQ